MIPGGKFERRQNRVYTEEQCDLKTDIQSTQKVHNTAVGIEVCLSTEPEKKIRPNDAHFKAWDFRRFGHAFPDIYFTSGLLAALSARPLRAPVNNM